MDVTWRVTVHAGCRQKGGPLFCFLAQMSLEVLILPCRGSISNIVGSFQSRGVLFGQSALSIECSLMSGCGQGHELVKDMLKKLWLKFAGLTTSRSENKVGKRVTSLNKTSRKYKGLNSIVFAHIQRIANHKNCKVCEMVAVASHNAFVHFYQSLTTICCPLCVM